jgi:hypothetical protein
MPFGWKLVIDSTNAPALADFWAAALEYEVEDPSALTSQLPAAGHMGSEAVVEYRGRRIFRGYAAIRHPEDTAIGTTGGDALPVCDLFDIRLGELRAVHEATLPVAFER